MTGTFDDWAQSVKLDKKSGTLHEKLVELPNTDEKIYYKVRLHVQTSCGFVLYNISCPASICVQKHCTSICSLQMLW